MSDLRSLAALDELARDPAKAADLPVEVVETMLARCHTLEGTLFARLLAARTNGHAPATDTQLVDAEDAARMLGRTTDWIYRNARSLPFAVQQKRGAALRFSREGIERYIREREGLSR